MLSAEMEGLIREAEVVAEQAYAPYSGFRVGSALLLSSGETVSGTNVENMSFGLTICAERSALVRAVAMYGPGIRVAAAAVVNLNGKASPPCGACRQVLSEFMNADGMVCFPGAEGLVVVRFGELMPYGFDFKLK